MTKKEVKLLSTSDLIRLEKAYYSLYNCLSSCIEGKEVYKAYSNYLIVMNELKTR